MTFSGTISNCRVCRSNVRIIVTVQCQLLPYSIFLLHAILVLYIVNLIRNKTSGTMRKMQFHLEHVFALTDHHKRSIELTSNQNNLSLNLPDLYQIFDRLVVSCIKVKESAVIFYAHMTIVNGALRFAPVCLSICLSVCPSFRHTLRYSVCVINSSHIFSGSF